MIGTVCVAGVFALMWTVGTLLPEEHVVSTRTGYGEAPDSVFAAITDVATHPSWRSDVSSVDLLSSHPSRWRETADHPIPNHGSHAMEGVTGIGGIFLKADDPGALATWYRDYLEVPVGEEGWTTFRWRHADDPAREGSTTWSIFPRTSDYFGSETASFMVNYRVGDLDAVLARLRAAGAEVDDRLEEYPYGRFGWATDPEGNRIELWEPVDAPADGAPEEGGSTAGSSEEAAEREVRSAQAAMIAAELAGDADALARLIAYDFHGVDPVNGILTKETVLEGYRTGRVSLEAHEVSEVQVRVFGSTAVVTGRARMRGEAAHRAFDGELSYMDVWVRGPGGWRLAAAHVAPVDAPAG